MLCNVIAPQGVARLVMAATFCSAAKTPLPGPHVHFTKPIIPHFAPQSLRLRICPSALQPGALIGPNARKQCSPISLSDWPPSPGQFPCTEPSPLPPEQCGSQLTIPSLALYLQLSARCALHPLGGGSSQVPHSLLLPSPSQRNGRWLLCRLLPSSSPIPVQVLLRPHRPQSSAATHASCPWRKAHCSPAQLAAAATALRPAVQSMPRAMAFSVAA